MAVHSLNFQNRSIPAFLPTTRSLRIESLSNTGYNAFLDTTVGIQVFRSIALKKFYLNCILQSPVGIPLVDFDFYCQKFGSASLEQFGAHKSPAVKP